LEWTEGEEMRTFQISDEQIQDIELLLGRIKYEGDALSRVRATQLMNLLGQLEEVTDDTADE